MKEKPKHPLIDFVEHIPVMVIKGFVIFLGFGLIVVIAGKLGSTFYMDHIYPIIMSVSLAIRILVLGIVGAIAHYTFWK